MSLAHNVKMRVFGGLFIASGLAFFAAAYFADQLMLAAAGAVMIGVGTRALTRAGIGAQS